MHRYMIEASYTPDGWRAMVENPDVYDGAWLRTVIQRLDGELDGFWWTASDCDAIVVCRLPDDIALAALVAAFKATGTISAAKVKILLSIDEQITALKKARGD